MSLHLKKFSLEGKVALVTGGAGLLGQEHCAALVETGAHAILADISETRVSEAVETLRKRLETSRVSGVVLDVTRPELIQEALKKVLHEHSRLDILINNAAIDAKAAPGGGFANLSPRLENFSLEQWNLEVAVGLTGAFLCSQIFGTHMANAGAGVILNIASDLSVIAPDQRLYRQEGLKENEQPVKPVTYSVIKTGLIGLTRYLAAYWACNRVRVNALSPGGVYTNQSEEFVTRLSSLIPMGRMARKEEYRSAVQFLVSDAASYLTGQNIVMDGGRSIL